VGSYAQADRPGSRITFARRPGWLKQIAIAPFANTHLPLPHGASPHLEPILLTFDDGPHAEYTPAVLDRLEAHGVRAAFFLLGKRITQPSLLERIAAAGHILGNHTFAHEKPHWCDFTRAREEVGRCQELVPRASLFRPPLGRLTPGLWMAARRRRLQCITWSLDSGDWRCRNAADASACARQVVGAMKAGDIVLFHDTHEWIGSILDVVLPRLRDAMGSGRPAESAEQ
jgi:peptidoglycan/xylan/chitin deacetylase (PgdA/CDA1 family)